MVLWMVSTIDSCANAIDILAEKECNVDEWLDAIPLFSSPQWKFCIRWMVLENSIQLREWVGSPLLDLTLHKYTREQGLCHVMTNIFIIFQISFCLLPLLWHPWLPKDLQFCKHSGSCPKFWKCSDH